MTTMKSQRTFSAAAAHVYELEDGKIRRFRQNGSFWEMGVSRLGSVGRSRLVSGGGEYGGDLMAHRAAISYGELPC